MNKTKHNLYLQLSFKFEKNGHHVNNTKLFEFVAAKIKLGRHG